MRVTTIATSRKHARPIADAARAKVTKTFVLES
jgi:hypothetical protein